MYVQCLYIYTLYVYNVYIYVYIMLHKNPNELFNQANSILFHVVGLA